MVPRQPRPVLTGREPADPAGAPPPSRPRRAGVVGSPVEHSLSPVLHRAAYAALGLDGWRYGRDEVARGGLARHVAGLGPEWVGLSVTMPGKEEALALAAAFVGGACLSLQARFNGTLGEPLSEPLVAAVWSFGSGLGLNIVSAICAAHEGSVEVDSAPGRGSTFTLTLPVHEENTGHEPDPDHRG